MIENSRITLLGGGYYECTPKWNRDLGNYKFYQSFAFFMPTSGEALMETAQEKCRLLPGQVYFVPSAHLVRQTCENEMSLYWVIFVTESYYLYRRLFGIRAFHEWPLSAVPWAEPVFREMAEFFLPPEKEGHWGPVRDDLPPGLAVRIEATVMHLTGILIDATEKDFQWGDRSALERLRPAIDYMDEHYLRTPSLAEIARRNGLAPNYFHRFFKKETGMTPFKYMEIRRLDLARKLLYEGRLNVAEIAQHAGYESQFYFSRAFKRRFGQPPLYYLYK